MDRRREEGSTLDPLERDADGRVPREQDGISADRATISDVRAGAGVSRGGGDAAADEDDRVEVEDLP